MHVIFVHCILFIMRFSILFPHILDLCMHLIVLLQFSSLWKYLLNLYILVSCYTFLVFSFVGEGWRGKFAIIFKIWKIVVKHRNHFFTSSTDRLSLVKKFKTNQKIVSYQLHFSFSKAWLVLYLNLNECFKWFC